MPQWKEDLIEKYFADAFKEDRAQADMDEVDDANILALLKDLTALPHLAGGDQDYILANYVKDKFMEYGLDHAEVMEILLDPRHLQCLLFQLKDYEVLLDYPDSDNPNLVQLINTTTGDVIFESEFREQGIDAAPNFVDSYLAYSPNDVVEGDLVYVNYGTVEDFEKLKEAEFQTDVQDKICIARYGQVLLICQ